MNRIAFVFPGQGSQSVGMLEGLMDFPEVAECLATANQVLQKDLVKLIAEGPSEELNQTQWTQPALLAVSVGLFNTVNARKELAVSLLAGHSLGEYSALVCAGALSFSNAIELVYKRGLYMQEAVPVGVGSMAAVLGLDQESIEKACQQAQKLSKEDVSPANYNSPGQIVIAGSVGAVSVASQLCIDAGAKRVLPLAVSVPSHCALMKPAAERLADDLINIELDIPSIPVLHNVDVASHDDQNEIKDLLVKQLYSPVKWTQTMEAFQSAGIDTVVECGPGKVLSGLFKRFDRELKVMPLLNLSSINEFLEF